MKKKDKNDSEVSAEDSDIQPEDSIMKDGAELDDSVVAEETVAEAIKNLREKIKTLQAEKTEYLTGWQRAKADLINARKRDEESQRELVKFANERLLTELIPVLEHFEMAISNKDVWEKVDKNWRMGVEYIYQNLRKILEENGLTEINPTGQKYDPMAHEAIENELIADKSKNGIITTVIQKGYSLNGKEIKAPKVKIGEFKGA